jgi:hypothetical protein
VALGHCCYVLCTNGKVPNEVLATVYFNVQKINGPFDVRSYTIVALSMS